MSEQIQHNDGRPLSPQLAGVPPIIGVVGGAGQMGQWLRRFWESRSIPVVWSDAGTELSNRDVVAKASITFVAVPLRITPDVLVDLAPTVRPEACLASIASVMEPSAAAMRGVRGEALCVHPVFGPSVKSEKGLTAVVAPVRGVTWHTWLSAQLEESGLRVRTSTPAEHDAAMAVVQAMLHSMLVALCGSMSAKGMAPEATLQWASPTMRLQLGLAARIVSQDAELYADLVLGNRMAADHIEALAMGLEQLAAMARSGDREAFIAAFHAARAGFGTGLDELAGRAESALERFS